MKNLLIACFLFVTVPCIAATPKFGQPMTDAELFANFDLDAPPLAAVKKAVESNDFAAAKAALASHLRSRTSPRWLVDWRHPAFEQPKDKPRRSEVVGAEAFLQHKFDYSKGPGQTGTIAFGAKIDWTANPTQGEARTHLWNESLNRHFHFRVLAEAYWETGDDRFAKEIADEIRDWAKANPPVTNVSGNSMPNGLRGVADIDHRDPAGRHVADGVVPLSRLEGDDRRGAGGYVRIGLPAGPAPGALAEPRQLAHGRVERLVYGRCAVPRVP